MQRVSAQPDPELAKRKAVAQPKAPNPKAEGVKPDPRKLAAMLQRMG